LSADQIKALKSRTRVHPFPWKRLRSIALVAWDRFLVSPLHPAERESGFVSRYSNMDF